MGSKQNTSQEKPLTSVESGSSTLPKANTAGRVDPAPSKIRALGQYFEDSKKELGKVSWPTKKEVKATGIAVLVLVCVMSFFLGIVDLILTKIVESILSIGI